MRHNNKQKLTQSASAIGAAILGFGVGALWGQIFSRTILTIILAVGGILHVYGMYLLQMQNIHKNSALVVKILWVTAWVCLLSLVSVFAFLVLK